MVLRFAAIVLSAIVVDAQDSGQTFVDLHNSARAEVGNLFWGNAGGKWTAADAVAAWVDEKQYYNCSDNSCSAPAGESCGHYTQVVWENTTRIGCATVTCNAQQGTFIVCDYNPKGNFLGQRPYAGCGQFNRSGMLSWDSTLAAYAEAYAEKRKTDCQKIPSHGPYGENIFQGPAGSGASDALFSWFGEKQNYNCTTNRCESGQACGEYTQLIWANSTRVGCASVTCDTAGGGTLLRSSRQYPR
nr:unnamed protein product [Digitaria exilis]